MPLIQTGNLNQRIKFVRDTTVKDEDGQVVPTSQPFLLAGQVQTQRLNDIKTSIGTAFEGTLTFIIRYQQKSELTNDMKVR